MDTEWLNSFIEAANLKSFSKASKANNISQPALSKHIQHLERDLGVSLFYRMSTGIELTEAGQRFYTRIRPFLDDLTSIKQELRQFNQINPIAIGSLPSIATYYLPSRIKALQDQPYSLLIQNTSGELIQSLIEGRLDTGFVDKKYVEGPLWSNDLFTEPYYAVFPMNHAFQSKKSVKLIELCEEPLIVHQGPCDSRNHILSHLEILGQRPNIIREVAFGEFIYGYVMAGLGITIVPQLAAQNLSHLELFTIQIEDLNRTISLITNSRSLCYLNQLFRFEN
ncbi:MAG: LysR family transcriptional regulator [Bacillota bacterium]|nr:LysR family transcriptional regulator [Bacillota bacterium]